MACHLLLVGMMGSGKSTVGHALADALGRRFLDLDAEIEREAGTSVAALFAAEGEPAFRARERAALAQALAGAEPVVVATGGGCPTDDLRASFANLQAKRPNENREALVATGGDVVWLRASPDVLARRLTDDPAAVAARPLLAGDAGIDAVRGRLAALAEARAEAYAAVATLVVDVDHRPVDEVVEAILSGVAHPEVPS